MKTHYSEESDDAATAGDTADEHVWRDHRLGRRQIFTDLLIASAALALMAFTGALWNADRPSPPPGVLQASGSPATTHPSRGNPRFEHRVDADSEW